MSRTQYYTAATLDGFIADPDNSLEWLFKRKRDEGGALDYEDFIAEVGALAMGATTYEWIIDHETAKWPYDQPSWVFSHRELPLVPDARIELVSGDVAPVHEAMMRAAGGKNVWIVGGGELAGQFYDRGLLDEMFVQVGSVTLGAGKPLLPRTIVSPPLRLISVKAVGTGFAELHYEVPRPGAAQSAQ